MVTLEILADHLDYNPETGVFTWLVQRRGGARAGDRAGSVNSEGYILIGLCGKFYRAHRLAWFCTYGEWPKSEIDHINRDKTDNRICNLRDVTRQTNSENVTRPNRGNVSGFRGVRAKRHRWLAEIRINGKQKQIGTFDSPEEAHTAYLAAKRANHLGSVN